MSRLEREFKKIDQLGAEHGNGVAKKLLVAALVICVNVFSITRNPDPDAINVDKLEGALASFRVNPENENIVACRDTTCTVDTSIPVLFPDQIPTHSKREQTPVNTPSVSAAVIAPISKDQDKALNGNAAFNFAVQETRDRNQLFQVPASALMRQGADAVVWLALDDLAVPIRVLEVARTNSKIIITETSVGLIRGLPISLANWIALSGNERSHIWLAARNLDQVRINKLLRSDIRIITTPDQDLRTGARIRSKQHG